MFSFSIFPKTAAMGRNERWKCHLECHLMSGDFEDDDQYTPTIDDNLSQDKAVISSLSAPDPKDKAWYPGIPSCRASVGMMSMP
jgi:hypothetical protein